MVNRINPEGGGIKGILNNAGFRPNGRCYCGCGSRAKEHFAPSGGHDSKFLSAFFRDQATWPMLEEAVRVHLATKEGPPPAE